MFNILTNELRIRYGIIQSSIWKSEIYTNIVIWMWQRWNYNRWNVQLIIHERTNYITTSWFAIQEFAQWIYLGVLMEIYMGFSGPVFIRSEVAKVDSHVMRRYQISNKWVKKADPDCKGKLTICAVKCMWNLVIILLIKIVGDKEWRSYLWNGYQSMGRT